MTVECVPGVTLEDPGDIPDLDPADDKPLEVAAALALAATYIVTQRGGTVDRTDISWGGTRSFPTCCDHVQVGIRTPGQLGRQNGRTYRPSELWWEVLVSQCRPKIDTDESGRVIRLPEAGFGCETPPSDSITGHAYRMHRITDGVHRHICTIARLYLPAEPRWCQQLDILAVDSERESCDQVRFTIGAAL